MSNFWKIAILIVMVMTGYFASDIYLPALPQIGKHFNITISQAQYTISIYLLGMAATQLVIGPVIDRYSYRRIALWLAIMFVAGSCIAFMTNQYYWLITARLLQAVSAGALSIIGRASLPLLFTGNDSVRAYLIVTSVICLSPAISPYIGGVITENLGWPSVFSFCALFGSIMFMAIYFRYKIKQKENNAKPGIRSYLLAYYSIISNKKFLAYAFITCAQFITYFAYLTESPFIFSDLNYQPSQIGQFYIPIAILLFASSLLARKLLLHIQASTLIISCLYINIIGCIVLGIIGYLGATNAYQIYIPAAIMCMGNVATSICNAKCVSIFPDKAGTASGLVSSMALASSMIMSIFINKITGGSISILAVFMLFFFILALFTALRWLD